MSHFLLFCCFFTLDHVLSGCVFSFHWTCAGPDLVVFSRSFWVFVVGVCVLLCGLYVVHANSESAWFCCPLFFAFWLLSLSFSDAIKFDRTGTSAQPFFCGLRAVEGFFTRISHRKKRPKKETYTQNTKQNIVCNEWARVCVHVLRHICAYVCVNASILCVCVWGGKERIQRASVCVW